VSAIEQHPKWSRIKLGVLNFSVCLDFDVFILLYVVSYTFLPWDKIIFHIHPKKLNIMIYLLDFALPMLYAENNANVNHFEESICDSV
jgi:hypothetical protein